ncbi:MAG: serine protease [Motiliproteus sp.]|nr:serine protease [Motiliproteus sp.]
MFTLVRWIMALMISFVLAAPVMADTAEQLFRRHNGSIVQIKVIDVASESKSAIGSGFIVGDGRTIATNYHVISSLVSKPDRYRIEVENRGRRFVELEIMDVDVVNDLALLRWQDGEGDVFELADAMPRQGEPIYSFGNPMDIGMTVVPGTYNGVKKKSFFSRIHLTASINPGMSGGPALDQQGRVVGVNVSTAGNQISFLVPVSRLNELLDQQARRRGQKLDTQQRMREQLQSLQRRMFEQVIAADWHQDSVGNGRIVGKMVPFVVCWGDSKEGEKTGLQTVSKGCHSDNHVYMGNHFTTGFFEYEFSHLSGEELGSWKFYHALERAFVGARPGNRVSKENVSNFQCHDDFFKTARQGSETRYKAHFCARQYKDFPSLYDVFYIAASINQENQALISHFTLSGIERDLAMTFTEKFIGSVGWK